MAVDSIDEALNELTRLQRELRRLRCQCTDGQMKAMACALERTCKKMCDACRSMKKSKS